MVEHLQVLSLLNVIALALVIFYCGWSLGRGRPARIAGPDPPSSEKTDQLSANELSAEPGITTLSGLSRETLRAIRQFEKEFKSIEEERHRVAKELHDEILPGLARLTRTIQSCQSDDEPVLAVLLDEIHNTVSAFRDLLGELHPVDLEELGLVAALSNIAKRNARLSGRCIIFLERTEEFNLTSMQELCLYRAVQSVLKMFGDSENDILVIICERINQRYIITIRCIDKRVTFADWLSSERPEYSSFDSLCALANAKLELDVRKQGGFPCDLIISAVKDKHSAQATEANQASSQFWDNLPVENERDQIMDAIDKRILPRLSGLLQLADSAAAPTARSRRDASAPGFEFDGPPTSKMEEMRKDVRLRIHELVSELRRIMADRQPATLENGLLPAICTLVENFKQASQIDAMTEIDAPDSAEQLDFKESLALYRITQEALNNIEKHSGANRVKVSLNQRAAFFQLKIEDNGQGLKPQRSEQSRGLRIIKERAVSIGAEVCFEKSSSFPSGTSVLISRLRVIPS